MIRRLAISAVVAALIGAFAPAAQAATDVYTTPGAQKSGDRLWSTTCEMYSSTVARCTTKIWATQVTRVDGRYVQNTGWQFNNLTYLPSARAQWEGNPLAAGGEVRGTAEWTSTQGRQWRTECDTAATGNGGCRSYLWTSFVALDGGRYVTQQGWVFNNLTRFAEGSVKPVTAVPASLLEQAVLSPSGFGPVQFGIPMADLGTLGYAVQKDRPGGAECVDGWYSSDQLSALGIEIYERAHPGTQLSRYITATEPTVATDKGARIGMTLAEVQALYDDTLLPQTSSWGTNHRRYTTGNVGGYELVFYTDAEHASATVTQIEARPFGGAGSTFPDTGC